MEGRLSNVTMDLERLSSGARASRPMFAHEDRCGDGNKWPGRPIVASPSSAPATCCAIRSQAESCPLFHGYHQGPAKQSRRRRRSWPRSAASSRPDTCCSSLSPPPVALTIALALVVSAPAAQASLTRGMLLDVTAAETAEIPPPARSSKTRWPARPAAQIHLPTGRPEVVGPGGPQSAAQASLKWALSRLGPELTEPFADTMDRLQQLSFARRRSPRPAESSLPARVAQNPRTSLEFRRDLPGAPQGTRKTRACEIKPAGERPLHGCVTLDGHLADGRIVGHFRRPLSRQIAIRVIYLSHVSLSRRLFDRPLALSLPWPIVALAPLKLPHHQQPLQSARARHSAHHRDRL